MRLWTVRYEKLTSVCVGPIICHGNKSSRVMFQFLFKFVFKFAVPYRRPTFTGLHRISSLHDKAFYISMKQATVIVITTTQSKEVLKNEIKNKHKRIHVIDRKLHHITRVKVPPRKFLGTTRKIILFLYPRRRYVMSRSVGKKEM